jgi:hypothetical protein
LAGVAAIAPVFRKDDSVTRGSEGAKGLLTVPSVPTIAV